MGEHIEAGQVWRRRKDGRLVRVERAINTGTSRSPYFDVRWRTIEAPTRSGACFEDYWLRDYELMEVQP